MLGRATGFAAAAPAVLQEGDRLKFVGLCSSSDSILVAASDGQALHIAAEKLKPQSRTSSGLRVSNWGGFWEMAALAESLQLL